MKLENNSGIIPEKQLEELLLQLRPEQPNDPLHPPVDDLTRRRMIGAVLADWESANQPRPTYQARRHHIIIALAAAAIVAAVLGGVAFFTDADAVHEQTPMTAAETAGKNTTPSSTNSLQLVPQSRFSLLQGEVNCGNMAVNLGASVPMERWIETRQGQSAFSLPTGIAVGLADNSAARVFWNGKRKYEVEITQGQALFSIDPQKSREGFSVRTPNGVINVTGTLFTVAVEDKGDVSVHLHRGKVEIKTLDNHVQFVEAGQTAILHEGSAGMETFRQDLTVTSQLHRLGCFDGGETFSELTAEDCDLIHNSHRGKDDGKPLSPSSGTARQRSNRLPAKNKVQTGTTSSTAELLRIARKARQDEKWNEAAAAYRQLIKEYPGTANSRTALVSLADIELKQLRNPQAALTYYNAYLAAPGALEREALYGKAKAFRLTNNVTNEIKTLTKLVNKYSSGPISQAASKRLEELTQ